VTRRWVTPRMADDDGSILLLTVGFTALVLALVLVVADASKLFLTRRSLVAAADGAALAGVQNLDRATFYAGKSPDVLPLDASAAAAAVRAYVADLADEYVDLELVDVHVGDGVVTVTLRARSRLPFAAYVGRPDGVVVEATAHATAPYVG